MITELTELERAQAALCQENAASYFRKVQSHLGLDPVHAKYLQQRAAIWYQRARFQAGLE